MLAVILLCLLFKIHAVLCQDSCWCFTANGVNIRDAPCGSVIGSADAPQCYTSTGQSQECTLSGTLYNFVEFRYGSGTGWAADDYLTEGNCPEEIPPGVCSSVNIVSRSEWGARPPNGETPLNTPVEIVFVHHTAGAPCFTQAECEQQMRNIQDYHMDALGWNDIGYNFLVGEDGRAYEGRGWDLLGAHTGSTCNPISVAVSLIGQFETSEGGVPPLGTIWNALHNVIDCAIQDGAVVPWSQVRLYGHIDACATTCPGDYVYDNITTWPWYASDTPCFC